MKGNGTNDGEREIQMMERNTNEREIQMRERDTNEGELYK